MILATNLLDEAWELCDRIAVLRAGEIRTIASPDELGGMTASTRRYTVELDFLDDVLLARMQAVPGVIGLSHATTEGAVRLSIDIDQHPRTLTEVLRAVSANGVSVSNVRPETVRPVDVFARLTEADVDLG